MKTVHPIHFLAPALFILALITISFPGGDSDGVPARGSHPKSWTLPSKISIGNSNVNSLTVAMNDSGDAVVVWDVIYGSRCTVLAMMTIKTH